MKRKIFASFLFSLVVFTLFPLKIVAAKVDTGELLALTNTKRLEAGIAPLTLNSKLSVAAQNKAIDMVNAKYWAHYSPSGRSPWSFISASGYKYRFAGENLARYVNSSTDTVTLWMGSELHRKNLLSAKYKDVGFYVYEGEYMGKNGTLVVQMFGSRN